MKSAITTGRITWALFGLVASGALLGLATSGGDATSAAAPRVAVSPPTTASAGEAPSPMPPADKVTVRAVPLHAPVSVGEPHFAHLQMLFTNGGSHHKGAPLRIDVRATGLLKAETDRLERGDARAPHAGDTVHELDVDVPFTAVAAGEGTLHADVEVFVCSADSCDPVRKSVSWRILAD